jgi:surface polysaccharide O-acyltransferase-like enzyme
MVTEKRIFWIDFTRAVAILLVVLLHSSADLFYDFLKIPMPEWFAALIYDSVSHIGVPLFMMVSGYTLLSKDESLSRFLSRRIGRLMLVILIWSLIYIGYQVLFENYQFHLGEVFVEIVKGPVYFHLWFLYTLLGLYLLLPVFRPYALHASPSAIWYFIVIWLLALIGLPSLEYYLGIYVGISLVQFGGFVGYLLIGFLLGRLAVNHRLTAAMIPIAIISPLATIIRTYAASVDSGAVYESFFSYLSPNVIFASTASFWLIKLLGEAIERRLSQRIKWFIILLSQASLGIYLVHPIVMKLLTIYLGFSPYMGAAYWSIPLVASLVTCITLVITYLLKKVPGVKLVV